MLNMPAFGPIMFLVIVNVNPVIVGSLLDAVGPVDHRTRWFFPNCDLNWASTRSLGISWWSNMENRMKYRRRLPKPLCEPPGVGEIRMMNVVKAALPIHAVLFVFLPDGDLYPGHRLGCRH